MAIDVRLTYQQSQRNYVDLFPHTLVSAIADVNTEFQKVPLVVTIPPSEELTQTIAITTDAKMPNSNFDVYLNTTGDQAKVDYSTISQLEVQANQLIVTRIYEKPTGTIEVTLVFYEKGD